MHLNNINKYSTFIGTDTKSNKKIFINNKDRLKHVLILGSDGCGKFYQTIVPMIKDDIENNTGILVLDNRCELAEYTAAKATHANREFIYFNPVFESCPKFNPLYGEESSIIEVFSNTFEEALSHLPNKLVKFNLGVLSRAIKVIKRAYQDDASLMDLYNLLYNPKDEGIKILHDLIDREDFDDVLSKENSFICEWFINFYKCGIIEGIDAKKYSIPIRQEIWNIVNNKLLKNCLITERGEKPDIIINDALENQIILCIGVNEGHLGNLAKILSDLFTYNIRRTIKLNRTLAEKPIMVYLNHAQYLLDKRIGNLISECQKDSIGLVISATTPLECEKLGGIALYNHVFNSCGTKIVYPYADDYDYGTLIDTISEKDIFFARYKPRSAHYIIQNSINNSIGVMSIDMPEFDDEFDKIDKLRIKYILDNKLLID